MGFSYGSDPLLDELKDKHHNVKVHTQWLQGHLSQYHNRNDQKYTRQQGKTAVVRLCHYIDIK